MQLVNLYMQSLHSSYKVWPLRLDRWSKWNWKRKTDYLFIVCVLLKFLPYHFIRLYVLTEDLFHSLYFVMHIASLISWKCKVENLYPLKRVKLMVCVLWSLCLAFEQYFWRMLSIPHVAQDRANSMLSLTFAESVHPLA